MSRDQATLIVFGGLPGTGKSTLANALAAQLGALYLRIDTIEQAIRNSRMEDAARSAIAAGLLSNDDIGPAGYLAAYGVAADNLSAGRIVVADSVNPIDLTRNAWQAVAEDASAQLVEVEVVCTDRQEHRQRVEDRVTDVEGLRLPTWQDVVEREYHPWTRAATIDTAGRSIEECLAELLSRVGMGRAR